MFALMVRFELRPDGAAGFDALTERTVAEIGRCEPGTVLYAVHRDPGEPKMRYFYELYRDRGAFEAHEAAPHTRRFLRERAAYLAAPPAVRQLDLHTSAGLDL